MLRRTLLAASESSQIRTVVSSAPLARTVVDRFVAGGTAADAVAVAGRLRGDGLLTSLDHLGEDTTEPDHAAAAAQEYEDLIAALTAAGLTGGATASPAEVSVKPTAVGLRLSPHGEKTATGNIARICAAARAAGTTVTIDMEDHEAVEPTLRIAAELRAEFPGIGCVIQSYLRRSERDCAALAEAGARVRLCKGAYSAPAGEAFTSARDVDRSYARCLRELMNGPGYTMVATHDPRLIEIAKGQAVLAARPAGSFEFQMLYGVRPAGQRQLAAAGERVRVYVPYGSDWYGYLVRRLAERPANLAFFLRALATRG
jgi:proline dehydrogenase